MGHDQLIAVGQVVGAHGVMGEARVYPLTDFPERFMGMTRVFLGSADRTVEITDVRQHGNILLMKFSGIDSREQAERLRGSYLLVSETDVHPLPRDTFYTYQLQGCEVVTESGNVLGRVADVITGTGNDLIVLRRDGKSDSYIPFVREFVKKVELKERRVTVSLIPGLIE